jgi:hypothetical protein
MDENKVKEVLAALDDFLIYKTNYKLQELVRVRNKLKQEMDRDDARQTSRNDANFASTAR